MSPIIARAVPDDSRQAGTRVLVSLVAARVIGVCAIGAGGNLIVEPQHVVVAHRVDGSASFFQEGFTPVSAVGIRCGQTSRNGGCQLVYSIVRPTSAQLVVVTWGNDLNPSISTGGMPPKLPLDNRALHGKLARHRFSARFGLGLRAAQLFPKRGIPLGQQRT